MTRRDIRQNMSGMPIILRGWGVSLVTPYHISRLPFEFDPQQGWRITAVWGGVTVGPPAGVENDRWAERGAFDRKQGCRMNAGH